MLFRKKYCKRKVYDINIDEMNKMLKNNMDVVLIDVRSRQEYNEGHLNNSINIPFSSLNSNILNVVKNKSKIIIVYCTSGIRSKKAILKLEKYGYQNIYNLKNGIDGY